MWVFNEAGVQVSSVCECVNVMEEKENKRNAKVKEGGKRRSLKKVFRRERKREPIAFYAFLALGCGSMIKDLDAFFVARAWILPFELILRCSRSRSHISDAHHGILYHSYHSYHCPVAGQGMHG